MTAPAAAVTLEAIVAARTTISGAALATPAWPAPALAAITGQPTWLKCEQLQRTGSFKIRGALNFVSGLTHDEAERGLVAASAGNHAQGVAFAARARGVSAVVVMPAGAPLAKSQAARALGAEVVTAGPALEDARALAAEIASASGRLLVPPFDHPAVIAGQGTVGLEIAEQVPDVDEVLVPAGGGGLLAGAALALKSRRPAIQVIGVQARAMDGIARSFAAGRTVTVPFERTIADGVAVAGPSTLTFGLIRAYVDEVVTVGENAIAEAIVFLIERSKVIAEGAGALAVAALLSGAYRPRGRTVAVLSGGNIDINLLGAIVRHGLVEVGRYRQVAIEVSDTPGELALVANAVAEAGANILEVEHIREAPHLPVGTAMLELIVEVNGPEHYGEMLKSLRKAGVGVAGGRAGRLATRGARRSISKARNR